MFSNPPDSVRRVFSLPFFQLWSFQPLCFCRGPQPWHICILPAPLPGFLMLQAQTLVECASDTRRDPFGATAFACLCSSLTFLRPRRLQEMLVVGGWWPELPSHHFELGVTVGPHRATTGSPLTRFLSCVNMRLSGATGQCKLWLVMFLAQKGCVVSAWFELGTLSPELYRWVFCCVAGVAHGLFHG